MMRNAVKYNTALFNRIAYLSGGDHDTNLFNSLGELFGFDSSIVVKIEIFERFQEDGLLALAATSLLT
jgi:hypothetical protein